MRLRIARRLADCVSDPRAPARVRHSLDEIIRSRMLMIAGGYEDGNDANTLRADPMFKLATVRLPDDTGLCLQPTISHFENLPNAHAEEPTKQTRKRLQKPVQTRGSETTPPP